MIYFTIPLAPVTKKNSQQIFRRANGSAFVTTSKKYKEYADSVVFISKDPIPKGIDYPVNVKALYFMPTRRKVDLVNLHSCLHDILVHYGILADDNYNIVAGTDGSRVYVDKNNPRTEIFIEPCKAAS